MSFFIGPCGEILDNDKKEICLAENKNFMAHVRSRSHELLTCVSKKTEGGPQPWETFLSSICGARALDLFY